MDGGDDRFFIFAPHDNMITKTNHFTTPIFGYGREKFEPTSCGA
jgi:hypothetical protein